MSSAEVVLPIVSRFMDRHLTKDPPEQLLLESVLGLGVTFRLEVLDDEVELA